MHYRHLTLILIEVIDENPQRRSSSPAPATAASDDMVAADNPATSNSGEMNSAEQNPASKAAYTKSNIAELQSWWERQIDYESDSFED